jgi:protein phosphatase 1 regulatory subunit 37
LYPFFWSQLARDAKEADEARAVASASSAANTPAGIARSAVFELSNADVLAQTEDAILSLAESCEIQRELGVVMEEMPALVEKGKALRERLGAIVGTTENEDRLQVLLGLVDRLSTQLEEADKAAPRPAATRRLTGETPTIITTPTRSRSSSAASQLSRLQTSDGFHLSRPDASTDGVTSPSFSLGDSDSDDSDNDDDASSRAESDLTSPSFRTTALPPAATPSADDVSEAADESALGSPSSEDGQPVEDNPIDQKSTNWIEEEGEVFRKGVALMAADVDEEDGEEVTGEQLKKEVSWAPLILLVRHLEASDADSLDLGLQLLEAQVERPRRLSSELNADELEAPVQSV